MIECGVIERVENDVAWVTVVKGEQCAGCQACKAFGENSAQVLVLNNLAAKPGNRVEIEIDPQQVIKHSSIVFLLPVFCLVAGYFLGTKYLSSLGLNAEPAGIIGSLGSMLVGFAIIALYDRFVANKREVNARVIRIL